MMSRQSFLGFKCFVSYKGMPLAKRNSKLALEFCTVKCKLSSILQNGKKSSLYEICRWRFREPMT